MSKERKSPPEKKQLEYTRDHFTFAEYPHAFRKQWPLKKALVNRKFRRKSDELLAQAKCGMSSDEAERASRDVTSAQINKSVTRQRLIKSGTVTVGERVERKLQKRKEAAGRRVKSRRKYDELLQKALDVLGALEGEQLTDCVRRYAALTRGGDPVEWFRLQRSTDPVDRALSFLNGLARGDANFHDALQSNEILCQAFQAWRKTADRMITRFERDA
jgi:hypothetical protein